MREDLHQLERPALARRGFEPSADASQARLRQLFERVAIDRAQRPHVRGDVEVSFLRVLRVRGADLSALLVRGAVRARG